MTNDSYIAFDLATGKAVYETWNIEHANKINRNRYGVVTAKDWLSALNAAIAIGYGFRQAGCIASSEKPRIRMGGPHKGLYTFTALNGNALQILPHGETLVFDGHFAEAYGVAADMQSRGAIIYREGNPLEPFDAVSESEELG